MSSATPIDVLFGAYRRDILRLLLLRPREAFHVREIERLTGIPAGSVHRELKALLEARLVLREPLGNLVRYRADQDCPIFPELASILREAGTPSSYRQPAAEQLRAAEPTVAYAASNSPRRRASRALRRLGVSQRAVGEFCRGHRLRKLAFFGSVTRDDFRPGSDVDVMVEFESGSKPSLFTISDLRDELSALFGGRPVDVITGASVANPLRREAIMRDLETVYAAK
jgi:predicted nucleotidyltransferase